PARSRHLVALAVAIGLAVPAALVVPEAAHAAGGQGLVAGAPVFTDSFTRSTSGGWGSSSGAAPYAHDVSSAFRVNGARGVIDLGRAGTAAAATIPAAVPADSESTVRITMPRVPSAGNGVSAGLQQRVSGSSYYQSTVRVDSTGTAFLSIIRVTGSTAAQTTLVPGAVVARGVQPGQAITLQSRVSGTGTVSVDARAWLDGQATPAWQAATADTSGARLTSGSGARVWSYLSASSSAQAVSFDD
ncbi:sortase, partial [Clavibacter sp. DM3]|nr:sortase [Clavibacter zhangzhiyongii]